MRRFGLWAAVVVAISVFAAGCSELEALEAVDAEQPERVKVPAEVVPIQRCLEAGGAEAVSVKPLGNPPQMVTVTAEAPETSARIVVVMFLEMTSIEPGGEEFTEPAEATATVGAGATQLEREMVSECIAN